jgi:hypothetical protein
MAVVAQTPAAAINVESVMAVAVDDEETNLY